MQISQPLYIKLLDYYVYHQYFPIIMDSLNDSPSKWKKKISFKKNIPGVCINLDSILNSQIAQFESRQFFSPSEQYKLQQAIEQEISFKSPKEYRQDFRQQVTSKHRYPNYQIKKQSQQRRLHSYKRSSSAGSIRQELLKDRRYKFQQQQLQQIKLVLRPDAPQAVFEPIKITKTKPLPNKTTSKLNMLREKFKRQMDHANLQIKSQKHRKIDSYSSASSNVNSKYSFNDSFSNKKPTGRKQSRNKNKEVRTPNRYQPYAKPFEKKTQPKKKKQVQPEELIMQFGKQYVSPNFRYCVGCEQPILQNNINIHENVCTSLQSIYEMQLSTIRYYLQTKIQKQKKRLKNIMLDKTVEQIVYEAQQFKNYMKKWHDQPNYGNKTGQYQKLLKKIRVMSNQFCMSQALQIINTMDWFIRVRERVQEGIIGQELGNVLYSK